MPKNNQSIHVGKGRIKVRCYINKHYQDYVIILEDKVHHTSLGECYECIDIDTKSEEYFTSFAAIGKHLGDRIKFANLPKYVQDIAIAEIKHLRKDILAFQK